MNSISSRRNLLRLAAAGAAGSALALPVTDAFAYQGNMERALSALQAALRPTGGGHRERAMRLIERAKEEVQAGINFAYQHGGGGY